MTEFEMKGGKGDPEKIWADRRQERDKQLALAKNVKPGTREKELYNGLGQSTKGLIDLLQEYIKEKRATTRSRI